MRRLALLAMALAALAFYACSSPPQPQARVTGAWRLDTTEIDFGFMDVGDLAYLEFEADPPRVHIYGTQPKVGLNGCGRALYGQDARLLNFWIRPRRGVFVLDMVYTFIADVQGDRLVLEDVDGRRATFERVTNVPEEAHCAYIEAVRRIPVRLPAPLYTASNLVSDGNKFWLAAFDGNVYPVDPDTGAVGAGQYLSHTYIGIQDVQGAHFWALRRTAYGTGVYRTALGDTVVDSVDTDTDLGHELVVTAAAYDGSYLWVFGDNPDADRYELLEVNADAEPDVLVGTYVLDLRLEALTDHDGKFWGLANFAGWQIVEINPQSGRVERAFVLPEPEGWGRYYGLTSHGGALYALADGEEGYDVYEFRP